MTDFIGINHDINVGPSPDDYRRQIQKTRCAFCGYEDLDQLPIEYFPHDGGWWLGTLEQKQWLFIHCPGCGYDWALWKLGVPR